MSVLQAIGNDKNGRRKLIVMDVETRQSLLSLWWHVQRPVGNYTLQKPFDWLQIGAIWRDVQTFIYIG
jgi:hypothetical protein